MPQGAVSTAAAEDCSSGPVTDTEVEEVDFTAHIFCMLIPYGRAIKMLQRTNSDPSLIGIPKDIPPWSLELDLVFIEGTGRVSPILKPEWEWKTRERNWFLGNLRTQTQFEKENPHFANDSTMQVPYVSHPKNSSEYNCFYRYLVGGYIPQEEGVSVTDLTFVYTNKKAYGVLVHDLVYDVNEPGLVYNETREEGESKFIKDCLNAINPVPQLRNRNRFSVEEDLNFLERQLGLVKWTPNQEKKHFGYFFAMEELRTKPWLVKINGPYESRYKYFGLDDFAAYIELCLYSKE
jgi:hypothetical protein